jgi:spermidine/putrescine transport system permease protein
MTTPASVPTPAVADGRVARSRVPVLAGLGQSILVLPGVVWLALFFLVPLALIFVISLGTRNELHQIVLDNPSLANYERAFNPIFWPTVVTSLYYATATTVLSIVIAFPLAYWISRYGGRHKLLLLLLMMLPFWTSYLIRTYAWMIILRDQGVVNAVLQGVGLTSEPIILMNTDFSVILGMTYGFLPFAILPLFVSIDRLDPNLVTAARDLYASGRQAFVHVTLPLVMPGLVAAALLTFIPALGDFVTPDLLGGAQVTTIAKVIQERFLDGRDWPYGAALGFVLMLVTLIGTFIALRTLRREVIGS